MASVNRVLKGIQTNSTISYIFLMNFDECHWCTATKEVLLTVYSHEARFAGRVAVYDARAELEPVLGQFGLLPSLSRP